ncbi:hypothetical protein TGPRC2_211250 [Toxoplasma gondii TgCatPRC2]|uniref:Uncharacterized protein n=6 Tax=Toxoplasma gondii TaxID=5811 RepID=S7UJP9_TOXGG|nr:hypothetical protein TGME49_211250 [Toxoplasma gondii ME49]EPR58251.1 hypothetical protein TGGT1_211250 [Toxoplasma gondii GT1]KAF4645065.1 hypothetical protein TGRH88_008810 [Toxoplasma gondii]KYF39448.1 hypothetical protein TGARI_211250 [Toxoplasma gondii ARI]KYK63878.1 hypothetical protein TGPRC2_211250 [Toxoplasma gondii TgCatPRC2]PIL97580.1 hypothetical protein TGCOUG_211250 [Toxoplasma gondii COUG]|eukprot:XP_002371260.1 hypothetical protein TGME49_211250 [Toxoplasma gondii ME49]
MASAAAIPMASTRRGEAATSAASSSAGCQGSTRLVDIGCFILRGDGLLVADPLSVGGTLDAAMASGGPTVRTPGAAPTFAEKKFGSTHHAQAPLPALPQGSLVLDFVAPGLWGVLAGVERMQPMGGNGDFSLLMDDGTSVNVLFLLNSAHMQMQQAELSLLQSLPWELFESCQRNRVSVTSGQLGVFTKHSLADAQEAMSRASPQAAQAQASFWYNRACELTCSEDQVGILDVAGGPLGCVSATGISEEGSYPIYVVRSPESEEIWAVKVEFLSS